MVRARALPTPASVLLGRAAELATVSQALLGPSRLVVLTGPPGVGKTRLAIDVAGAVAERFADGVAWVDLTGVRDADAVVDEIALASGVVAPAALADRELLVVLDNCEHLLGAGPALADLLADHPALRVLATSRERFRIAAEAEFSVDPLSMPELEGVGDLRGLADNPAVALMLARAPAYVELTARTAQPLVEICRRLDGLPLALEFAAARLRVFTPAELAFRLEQQIGELHGTARDAPARHRDIRAAIAWSHDLLPASERAVLRRLSVFEGPWTVAAAAAVAGGPDVPDVLAAVESLLDKSLVRRVDRGGGGARFGMLVSIREFAAEQLAAHDEGAATRDRHGAWFAEVARDWERTVGTSEENLTWEASEVIRSDLELALLTVRGRDAEATLWLLSALFWFWYTRGSPVHAVALSPTEDELATGSADARAAMLTASGVVAFALGDLSLAEAQLGRAQEVASQDDPGSDRRRAFTVAFLGHVDRELGRHDASAGRYRQARSIYESLGNGRGVAWAVCDLGLLSAELADPEAEEQLREALMLFESLDYSWAVAVASCGLAGVLLARGDSAGAAALGASAWALHEQVGDMRGTAQSLEVLADVALARREAATATRLLGAGAARRDQVAAHPTAAEQARVARVRAAAVVLLGDREVERGERAGRQLSRAAVAERVGQFASARPDADEPALTDRQLEVAVLVAAGRTNRQIARELGISEKTAELHLSNAMQRLGVPNRAGVAAWVATRPEAPPLGITPMSQPSPPP